MKHAIVLWGIVIISMNGGILSQSQGAAAEPLEEVTKQVQETIDATTRYTAQQKEAFQQKAEKEFVAVQKQIDALRGKANRVSARARGDLRSSIEELEKKKVSARKKLNDLRAATDARWGEVRAGISIALDDLKASYRNAVSSLP